MPYNVEMESPEPRTIRAGDVELAAWEWPGEGPALVFAHATGFHGRVWDTIVRRFPGRRRVAIDHRGHGRSSKPAPPYLWPAFGNDLRAAVDALGLAGAIGIGHSMGGHTVAAAGEVFSALLLIDPTIVPRNRYGERMPDVSFIRRRKNRWTSPSEMFERFHGRAPFSSWRTEILRDYCEHGLLPQGGHFVLACPPEVEASIYEHARDASSDIYPAISQLEQPVTVVRSAVRGKPGVFDLSASPTAPDLASHFRDARDVCLEDRNHYIPMTSPEIVAEEITRLLSRRTGSHAGSARL